ncbi:MAG: hypothetical protein ABIC04_03150 [Nanoarchaeota archaeon]
MRKITIFIWITLLSIGLAAAFPDIDKDNIADDFDKCAGTDATLVDIDGCSCSQKTDISCSSKYTGARCCQDNEVCATIDFKIRCSPDSDKDNIADEIDNCPSKANPNQDDSNNNKIGDICDTVEEVISLEPETISKGLSKETVKNTFIQNWEYDEDDELLIIRYLHSRHDVEIYYDEPEHNVKIIDTTSLIFNEGWEENKLKLTLEGSPDDQGITKLKSEVKPAKIRIDDKLLKEVSMNFPYWIIIVLTVTVVILSGFIMSQRKKTMLEDLLEIKTYVIDAINRGYTKSQIKQGLITDGWNKTLVEKAMNSITPPNKATPMQLVEMQNYILINVKKGFSKQQIKSTLQKDGWPISEIEQAFNNLNI